MRRERVEGRVEGREDEEGEGGGKGLQFGVRDEK